MNTRKTALLLISLWALSCARPVSRHQATHHRSSEEHWATAIEESLNEVVDTTDVSDDEDRGSRLSVSTESRGKDPDASEHGSTSHESSEGNSFPRKVSSGSLESISEDDHEWSTRDNDDGRYFRPHQTIHRKWADDEDSHGHSDQSAMNGGSFDDQSAGRTSLEHQNEIHEGHFYSGIRKSKEQSDVENDGMLYTPDQVSYTFMGKGGSDLANDEDTSGDDNLDGHNGEDPGHTVPPSERDGQQLPVTNGEQDGDNAIGRHHDDSSSSSSSSSSSESRNLEKEDNHIVDYGKRHGGDSFSSSQEDRYDFSDEGMQGDDPRIFESHDSDSRMLRGVVHSKESSQQISREKGKGKAKHHNKAVEHFARQVYHYVDDDSEEDHSPEHDESKSLQEDDVDSKENSQSVEGISQSTENVPSRSREDATSHSREAVESLSRGHSHSQSRENFDSQSREDKHSRSREDKHSQSREDKHSQSREDKHSQSREDKHSQSREDKHSRSREDKHSRSREVKHSQSREDKHSQSREDDVHSQSREDNVHSQSKEDDVHSRSREDDVYSQSKEDDVHSRSREDDVHSQSREDVHSQSREDLASQSREDENSQSREDDDTVSVEDTKSESTEDSRGSHEKAVKMSKELGEKSDELSASKSKEQESDSTEEVGNVPPRDSESREVKRQHSRSTEKSTSREESEESAEDTNESIQDDSRSSHSASSDSSKSSQESASSEDSDSNEDGLKSEESAETSESKDEENSHSLERGSHSREDTMSMEDDSWSRSMELESRKLMLDIDHNKPFSDYDDNDCQDGY